MADTDPSPIETDLASHRRHKKELRPPLAEIPMTNSSWKNQRMPEMLWAVLIINGLERDKALAFFRYVAKFVESHPHIHDVTLGGISRLIPEDRIKLIQHIMGFSPAVKGVLRPLGLFPELPGASEWRTHLPEPVPEEDWQSIGDGVEEVLDHQSEKATDCRWLKLLCLVAGGKLQFASTMQETVRGILEYPNYGDLRRVRPSIRAAEINFGADTDVAWTTHFWSCCHKNTACIPQGRFSPMSGTERGEWEKVGKHYFEEAVRVRHGLITHYLETTKTTAIDSRHETAFGFALYATTLFTEVMLHRLFVSVTARLNLRALAETYITFAYLLKKETPATWQGYRDHGVGQAKLVHLKLKDLKDKPSAIDEWTMYTIANEDAWQEFVTINLGHWDETNLKDMSEEAGLKEVYDKFYTWSSGYIHATWAGMRETVFEFCVNPLHRYHHHPSVDFPTLPSVVMDGTILLNSSLELLEKAYPSFKDRIALGPEQPRPPIAKTNEPTPDVEEEHRA